MENIVVLFRYSMEKKMTHDSFCIDSSGNVESKKLRNFVYTTNFENKNIRRRGEKWWQGSIL